MSRRLAGCAFLISLFVLFFVVGAGAARADDDDDDPKSPAHAPVKPKVDKPATPKPEPKVEAKPAPKIEPKVEARPEPKVETKPAPKIEPKVEAKPEPKVEARPEPKPAAKVVARADAKPDKPGRGESRTAPGPLPAEPATVAAARSVRVRLVDGSTVTGTIRAELSEALVVDCNLGLLSIPRARIAMISYDAGPSGNKRAPVQQLDDDLPPPGKRR